MTVDNALKELRELLITELSSSQNVELEPLIEGLGMSEEEREDLDDEILDSSQGLIGLARHLNETPMTNTSASAVWLLDIGGDYQFLYSPGDSWVDYPATVFALVPTGDLSAVFKEVGSIIVWSRRNGELPAAGSLHDDIGVCEGFPTAVLEDAYTELFMDPLDAEEAKELLEHYGRVPSHSGPITSRALAHAYVAMALGED